MANQLLPLALFYFSNRILVFPSSFFSPAVPAAASLQVLRMGKDCAPVGRAMLLSVISPALALISVSEHTQQAPLGWAHTLGTNCSASS